MKKYVILIPVYNDRESLTKLIENINSEIEGINSEISIVVINDASSQQIIDEYQNTENINSIEIVNMKENRGHARCIASGLKYIYEKKEFDYVIPMDGDGEDRPEEIKNFIELAEQTDGKSLVPLLDNYKKTTLDVDFALSQYPRQNGKLMGYSIRTERYRYTEWHGNNYCAATPYDAANIQAVELYDFKTDPSETKNHAADKENEKLVKELQARVQAKVNSIYEKNKLTPAVPYTKKPKDGADEEGIGGNGRGDKKNKKNPEKKSNKEGKNKKKKQE